MQNLENLKNLMSLIAANPAAQEIPLRKQFDALEKALTARKIIQGVGSDRSDRYVPMSDAVVYARELVNAFIKDVSTDRNKASAARFSVVAAQVEGLLQVVQNCNHYWRQMEHGFEATRRQFELEQHDARTPQPVALALGTQPTQTVS